MTTRLLPRRAVLGAAAIGAAAWPGLRPAGAATPADALILGGSIEYLSSFDTAVDTSGLLQSFVRSINDFLVRHEDGRRGVIVPDLAQRWDVSEDGRIWAFHLDPAARFASGNPVTSGDVVYTMVRMLKIGQTGATNLLGMGWTAATVEQAVVAVDAHTVRMTVPQPLVPRAFLNVMGNWKHGILDSVLLKQKEKDGDFGSAFLRSSSAGGGAFRIAQFRPNDLIVFERNEASWRPPAPLRRVLFRHIPDAGSAELALQKGDIDVSWAPPQAVLERVTTGGVQQVVFGPTWEAQLILINSTRKPFDDVRVRQALKCVLNWKSVDALVGPYGIPQQSFLEPHHFGYTGAAPFTMDLEKATRLLKEAGHPDGFSTTLRTSKEGVMRPILEEFQQNAAKIGVKIDLRYEMSSTLSPALRNRDYDLASFGSTSHEESDGAATDYCENPDNEDRAYRGRRSARTGWQNPEAQRLVPEARVERDEARRAALYKRLQDLFFEDSSIMILFNEKFALTTQKAVQGITFRPDMFMGLARKERT